MPVVFRPVRNEDFDDLSALIQHTELGITTLPYDVPLLEQKITKSLQSFQKEVVKPDHELYVFVAEDLATKKIIGTSAIQATTGEDEPLYFFRKEYLQNESTMPEIVTKIPILNPLSYIRGPSEVCSLLAHPDFRKIRLGKLLSLSRFLFIAKFSERFTGTVFAEMRGIVDERLEAPFWEGVGRKFLNITFEESQKLLKYGRAFIGSFLPKHPIYISLLPKNVQDVIGKTHPNTQAAEHMLLSQGFEHTNEIDIFDAGPKLYAYKEKISAIRHSVKVIVEEIQEIDSTNKYLISNEHLDFRATIGCVIVKASDKIILHQELAEILQVKIGDTVRIYSLEQ